MVDDIDNRALVNTNTYSLFWTHPAALVRIIFNRVTSLFGQLPHYFCKPIKIAVMTFDHEYFVKFCFDKFENTEAGRMKAGEAISYIPYIRKGQENETRWTHTAGAARCACDYMLTPIYMWTAPSC